MRQIVQEESHFDETPYHTRQKRPIFCGRLFRLARLVVEFSVSFLLPMNLDPHSLSQIIQRIYQQMRCPQCGKRVPVDFASVRIVGDDFLLLQLKCDTCDAYIVLHASLQGAEHLTAAKTEKAESLMNASSTLSLSEGEIGMLRQALGESEGSFEKLFEKYGSDTDSPSAEAKPGKKIA